MDLHSIPYESCRKTFLSEKFLREYYQIDDKDDHMKNQRVINLIYKIAQVPNKPTLTLAGYGSLLNEKDVPRTLRSGENHRLGHIRNWERVFNVGFNNAYLNVRPSNGELLNVALVDFKYQDLPKLIDREFLYDFTQVKTISGEDAIMVVGEPEMTNDTSDPQLNYLHLCITGANKLGGLQEVNRFLDTTYCYCHEACDQVTAREYLKNLNLTNYIIKNEYSSR